MKSAKQIVIDSLLTQKELYGNELFTTKLKSDSPDQKKSKSPSTKKTSVVKEVVPVSLSAAEETPKTLDDFYGQICSCQACALGSTRKNFVFGVGNPNARVMLVGEGPGADEDEQGIPFVGRAGQLLTKILEAISFKREEVYIANIVKCRPPGNRTPLPLEIETCIPYLYKQIEIIKPKLILCLGTTAAVSLLKQKSSLSVFRNKVHKLLLPGMAEEIQLMVTYHPAALLRNPNWKKDCWADVQMFRKLYDEMF